MILWTKRKFQKKDALFSYY